MDKNALFLKAVGGPNKKNRVYGVGSSQNIFYQSKSILFSITSATKEENQILKSKLAEINDRMKTVEIHLAMIIEANYVRRPQSPNDLDGLNDDN